MRHQSPRAPRQGAILETTLEDAIADESIGALVIENLAAIADTPFFQVSIADQYLEALVNEHREAAPKDANAGQSCRGVR